MSGYQTTIGQVPFSIPAPTLLLAYHWLIVESYIKHNLKQSNMIWNLLNNLSFKSALNIICFLRGLSLTPTWSKNYCQAPASQLSCSGQQWSWMRRTSWWSRPSWQWWILPGVSVKKQCLIIIRGCPFYYLNMDKIKHTKAEKNTKYFSKGILYLLIFWSKTCTINWRVALSLESGFLFKIYFTISTKSESSTLL